jgi:hypothetical protein
MKENIKFVLVTCLKILNFQIIFIGALSELLSIPGRGTRCCKHQGHLRNNRKHRNYIRKRKRTLRPLPPLRRQLPSQAGNGTS